MQQNGVQLMQGDCLELMRSMPADSVDLILTDPPYFKVKDEPWDNQWAKPDAFLSWLDSVLAEFQRILKPNGSLYMFASPQMAARVEVLTGSRFNILNSIRWQKADGWHKRTRKEDLRRYLTPWEAVIFAEQFGADNSAKGETGYAAQCDDLRGFVFEPLRSYLEAERKAAGLSREDVRAFFAAKLGTKGKVSGHFYDRAQWMLPTPEMYEWLRECHNARGGQYLRREYEDLRRPFAVDASTLHTDSWHFDAVRPYPGKHPCEKPAAMLEHIITASSRPCAVVFDAFMGTGSTGIAAVKLGRKFIGCEMAEHHFLDAKARIASATPSNDNQPIAAAA